MADRSISVRFRANITDFVAEMGKAASSTDKLSEKLGGLENVANTRLGRLGQRAANMGSQMTVAGTALAAAGAGLVFTAKQMADAAIEWESAWAGVTKTVDGSDGQMAALQEQLRGLAKELPSSSTEIASVAEAAGQLGVKVGDVAAFTRTMIDLGNTTNLSADEAATTLARFNNIMGLSNSTVRDTGNTIVSLGNNFATTESEIAAMALRLAGAGRAAGLSSKDVLGLSAALSSMGIEAEAGGSAMSRIITSIKDAAVDGGSKLQTFAQAAGMTASEFQQLAKTDPAQAVLAFTRGMGEMEAAGKSTTQVFKDLKLNDLRVMDAVRRIGQGAEVTARALDMASEKTSALSDEAEKRYQTTASQIEIMKNNVNDLAINMGSVFLPAINGGLSAVNGLAGAIGSLPEPLQQAIAGFTGIAGAVGVVGGGLLILLPRLVEGVKVLRELGIVSALSGSKLGGFLTSFGGVAGKAGLIGAAVAAGTAALAAIGGALDDARIKSELSGVSVDKLSKDLLTLADSGKTANGSLAHLFSLQSKDPGRSSINGASMGLKGSELEKMAAKLAILAANKDSFFDFAGTAAEEFSQKVKLVSSALAEMVESGHAQQAKEVMGEIEEAFKKQGYSADEARAAMPEYTAALEAAEAALGRYAESAGSSTEEMVDLAAQMGMTSDEFDKFIESCKKSSASLIDVAANTGEAWKGFDVYLQGLEKQSQALQQWNANLEKLVIGGQEDLAARMIQMGPETAGQIVASLFDPLGQLVPEKVSKLTDTYASIDLMTSMAGSLFTVTDATKARINEQVAQLSAEARQAFYSVWATDGLEAAAAQFNIKLTADTTEASAAINDVTAQAEGAAPVIKIGADPAEALAKIAEVVQAGGKEPSVVDIHGNPVPAQTTLGDLVGEINTSDGMVTINGEKYPAETSLQDFLAQVRSSSASATVNADTSAARNKLLSFRAEMQQILSGATIPTRFGNVNPNYFSVAKRASGGIVTGPGTSTSDSIPAWLSNGEFVIQEKAARHYGYKLFEDLNSMRLAKGGPVGAVQTGSVAPATSGAKTIVHLTENHYYPAPQSPAIARGQRAQRAAHLGGF